MSLENKPPEASSLIKFLSGPLNGKVFPLNKLTLEIGRDAANDIVVFDPKVSRQHARIRWEQGKWLIENLSHKSVITINQRSIQLAPLVPNVVVQLGDNTSFVFLQTQPGQTPPPSAFVQQPTPPPVSQPYMPAFPHNRTEKTVRGGMPMLEVSSNVHQEKQIFPFDKPLLSIGRNSSNDIVINEPVVSGFHAQIIQEGDQWIFVHPHPNRGKTMNGVLYKGQSIRGDEPFRKPLINGDLVRIGDEHGTLVTLTYNDGLGLVDETLPEVRPLPLGAPLITIGRNSDNTVVLNHPQVSGNHARLEQFPGGYRLIDMNSTNHVYVNSQRVTNHILQSGDEIRIGPFRFTYANNQLTQYDESSSIRIDALDLRKSGTNNVVLLNGISLAIPPRKFVALVGGSGAGKSTLMDALNGLRPAQAGTVLYNGQDYYHNLAAFSTQLGYVPQDDIVHRDLTVERALYYAARMRLPSDYSKSQIEQRIAEVLEDVEMTERRRLLVSRLSGGQRKRVSIALELLANPSIFFLDEPTSGLDPGLDRKMMFLLRRLADRGRTIILVTHATNNINACDYVCFLAQGGRMAFFGPPNDAKTYFEKTDFAEIYSTLEPTKEHPQIPQEAEARFKSSPYYQRYVVDVLNEGVNSRASGKQPQGTIKRAKRGNPWKQFLLLSQRYVELLKNDVGNLLLLLLQAPVVALLLVGMVRYEIGAGVFNADKVVQCQSQILVKNLPLMVTGAGGADTIDCSKVVDFLKNDPQGMQYASNHGGQSQALQDFILPGSGSDAQKVLFIMAFAAVLFGCVSGAREIVKEANIYRRERAVDLGIIPYMFSKIAVLGVLSLFQSAVLLFIVDLVEPVQQGVFLPVLLETYITIALCSLGGLLIGLTISALAPNNDWAISFIPIILIPQVIFAGAIIPFKDWLTQILAVGFPTRWALAALCSSIGVHSDKIGKDRLFGNDYTYHGTLFSTYTHQEAVTRIVTSWGALAAIIVILIIVIGLALKRKDIRG
jgi:ABC-type multidrug transport system ATPase subunit/pSer/pThr/pTyr-binding forkhead associated (FHA) protein